MSTSLYISTFNSSETIASSFIHRLEFKVSLFSVENSASAQRINLLQKYAPQLFLEICFLPESFFHNLYS